MRFLFHLGRYFLLIKGIFTKPEKWRMYWKETLRQIDQIGVGSLIIIAVVSIFIGAVSAVQFAYQISGAALPIPMSFTGYVVRESMILELAPTISCLLLAGKVGSNIASELGTMRISEQIDALEIMGVNTSSYLIGPKISAAFFIIPFLVIIAAALGIGGGLMAGVASGILSPGEYYEGLTRGFDSYTVVIMLVKAVIFAFILTSIACYQGYYVKGGALEIGAASTRAVVLADIVILLADYLIAAILL